MCTGAAPGAVTWSSLFGHGGMPVLDTSGIVSRQYIPQAAFGPPHAILSLSWTDIASRPVLLFGQNNLEGLAIAHNCFCTQIVSIRLSPCVGNY